MLKIRKRMLLLVGLLTITAMVGAASYESRTSFIYPPFKHTWGVVRATPNKLFMLVGNRAKFAEPLGLSAVRLDSWDDPKATKDDDEITVYGVNSNQNMIIYNKSMYELGIYGDKESGNKKLNKPWGVAANNRGDVYISDMGNNRVVKMFNPKTELKFVNAIGSQGTGDLQFNSPRGIALDNYGRVYVCDYNNNRVQIINSDGSHRKTVFGLLGPISVSVMDANEKWSYVFGSIKEEFFVVVDSMDSRVTKYSLDGEILSRVTSANWGVSETQLQFSAIDYFSQILLTDRKNHCIWKLDRDLRLLTKFGKKGGGDYEFDSPRGITLYRRFGQTLVAEKEGAQYFWVGVDILHPEAKWDEKNRKLTITGHYTEPAFVDIDLLDNGDKVVTRIAMMRALAGRFESEWDGTIQTFLKSGLSDAEQSQASRFEPGKPVAAGNYKVRISSKATYSSIKDFEKVITLPVSL